MIALLLAALLAAPAPLPVEAEFSRGALVVTWPAPVGQAFGCVFRDGALLGCVAGSRYQLGPGSVDIHLRTDVGALVEVRSYSIGGATLSLGQARVFGRVRWLPMVLEGRPRR
jgi:hypothetical protein